MGSPRWLSEEPGVQILASETILCLLTYHFLEEQDKEDTQTTSRKIHTKGKKETPKLLRNSSSKTASKTKKEHSEIGLSSPGISTHWDSECFSRFAPRTATNHSALGRTPTHHPRYCHQLDALFQNGEWLPHSWSSWPCRVGVPGPPS